MASLNQILHERLIGCFGVCGSFFENVWRYFTAWLRRMVEHLSCSRSKQPEYTMIKDVTPLTPPIIDFQYEYNMTHAKRGMALIFNQKFYEPDLKLNTRIGTEKDVERLTTTLNVLDFNVKIFNDLRKCDILQKLKMYSELNHSKNDCIVVIILTHGNNEGLYARDELYNINQVTSMFTDAACPSLKGKPKLFLIQACRGEKRDYGHKVNPNQYQNLRGNLESADTTPLGKMSFELMPKDMIHNPPNHPDFLIVRSTVPEFVSFRNLENGSWFVQHLCDELDNYGNMVDILTILTITNEKISRKETELNQKQILCISTMLRKQLIFHKKV